MMAHADSMNKWLVIFLSRNLECLPLIQIFMKTLLRFSLLSVAFTATWGLTGCNTFEKRTQEKAAVYNALNQGTQERLKKGTINLGDTEDMVYIALSRPDEKRKHTTAGGTESIWIYKTYWQQYEGTTWVGWRRVMVPAKNGRGYAVFYEPVTQDVYSTHVDETIRIAFKNGQVTSIEEQKR